MIIYTVLEGDTLLSIAQSYNTTVSRIAADNRLDPALPLVVGQTLVILYPEKIYTAREGDTVLSIARAFGISAVEIWQNNPILSGQNALFPGQTIVISYGAPSYGEISLLGYAYTYIDDELLRRTLPYLTYLSVFPYGLEADGSIVIPEGDDRLITTAKEYNTLPLMTLTSLTVEGVFSTELINSILASPTLSERVIQNAVSLVQSKGLGGVDMDFEFISPEYRENYADFIRRLKEALGDGYVVFTDLAPKTRDDQPGLLYEAHDYSSLGTFSDKLFLMTYEWGYMYGPPGAVSPINNVRTVIEYGISRISPDKIFMGLPSYGYDWPLPFVRGETRAETISPDRAVELARLEGSTIYYDTQSQAPYFNYTRNGVEHVVWFEDGRSANALASLANEYALDGIGIWNIMRWFPQLWPVLKSLYSIRKLI